MTPERWQQIKDILVTVLERPAGERSSFLDQTCNGDDALRAEVESLIAHEEAGDSILESAKISDKFDSILGPMDTSSGGSRLVDWPDENGMEFSRLGPYKIVRELGRGGVGTVYLAERDDEAYRQQVAIKLIRRGMDTDFILRRFRNERQILAALDHSYIARLFDGGTTEKDRPYLVMEYVEGAPVDVYCDQQKLDIEARLKLFRQVCAAVHYAHQHLVIHRDIKPSNILVTKEGAPKLLDFGIAKLLTPELAAQTLDLTLTPMRLLTPAYASPEQIKGQPITTASDVYSLGVLLHELLTGHKPYHFETHAPQEMMQTVLNQEPTRPSTAVMASEPTGEMGQTDQHTLTPDLISKSRNSTPDRLRRRLRGDLDNIVLTALRKDPQRRYASVEQFSEDISRHLKGLPVMARADSFGYRTAKFIQRHRIALTGAAMLVVTLVGGIVAVNQQRRRAEQRFNDVRKLAHSVVFDYNDAVADLPGSTPVRQRMVKDALEYLDSLATEAAGDRTLQRELASAYRKIGDVQGNSNMANLGDTSGALISYRKSLGILHALNQAEPANAQLESELGENFEKIGDALRTMGAVGEAEKNYQQAISLLEKSSATGNGTAQRRFADLLYRVGNLKGYRRSSNLGDSKGALEYHNRALTLRESLAAADPNNVDLQVDMAESHRSIANMFSTTTSDLDSGEKHARQAVVIAQSLINGERTSARGLRVLTEAQDALARQLLLKGELADALEVCVASLQTAERLLKIDPKNMQARQDLASGHTLAGNILLRKKNLAEALKHHREALMMDEAILADDPTNAAAKHWIVQNYMNIGTASAESGNLKEGLQNCQQALSILEALRQAKPDDMQTMEFTARVHERLAEIFEKLGNLQAALESQRHSIAFAEQALARDPVDEPMRRLIASAAFSIGELCRHLAIEENSSEQWQEARKAYQRSLDLSVELRSRGALLRDFAAKADQLPGKIAACDTALTKIH